MAVKRMMGMSATKVYDQLQEEYGVQRETLKNDWVKRDEWMPELFEFEDMDAFVSQLIAEQQFVKQRLWAHYDDADNAEVKRRILSDIRDMGEDLLGMMQDLGQVYKEPDKVQHDLSSVSDDAGEVIDATLKEISGDNGHSAGEIGEDSSGETAGQIPAD